MKNEKEPRLRTVEKIPPPFPLGEFPSTFAVNVGKQIIYLLATKQEPSLEGPEWEQIFAKAITATWKPSNVGLDDIVLGNCAWGAKTVKNNNPWNAKKVRLISGRNSPVFSFGSTVDVSRPPEEVGSEVLNIWNGRVESVRSKYKHLRSVVLIKGPDLLKLTVFESEIIRFDSTQIEWSWNKNGNLTGHKNGEHLFTWQPHGSQFTIIEDVPDSKLCFKVRQPDKIPLLDALNALGFDDSWIEVVS